MGNETKIVAKGLGIIAGVGGLILLARKAKAAPKVYTCPYCGAPFDTYEELASHIQIEHPAPTKCEGFDLYRYEEGNWVLIKENAIECGYKEIPVVEAGYVEKVLTVAGVDEESVEILVQVIPEQPTDVYETDVGPVTDQDLAIVAAVDAYAATIETAEPMATDFGPVTAEQQACVAAMRAAAFAPYSAP